MASGKSPLLKAEREKIESVVRDYILENPEIIIQAIQGLREREERDSRDRAQANLVKLQGELLNDPDTPVGANLKGDVTIVEFFDYRCGYCKRVFPDIMKLVDSDKDIRFVYKEFPILGPESVTASKAGLAAWILDKSKYEAFHTEMMTAKGALPESRVMGYAAKSGYDTKALKKIMQEPRINALIEKNMKLARALDINGTPAFIIGNEVIRGAVDLKTLKTLVSKARGS
ncbi:MAG: DsbA family protein [Rhodospirillales bacterium]|nr:DsbA family protein [Rhodospirillales bacterium]